MYRLSNELAGIVISMIKPPEFESAGSAAFLPKRLNSVGIIDPVCCAGSAFNYTIESPKPILYPNFPFTPSSIDGYFLYSREELQPVQEKWEINRVLVDPTATDPEELIDVSDSAVVLPSDIDKLTAQTLSSIDQLVKKEPMIVDCLDWGKKHGK
jgi:hypothetical protein